MVDVATLKPGDVVQIVSEWNEHTRENGFGGMDHWLGGYMTVKSILSSGKVKMVEDEHEHEGSGWYWNSYCIDHVVKFINKEYEIEPIDADDFVYMFFR